MKKKPPQYEQVAVALEKLGGIATLSQLYRATEDIGEWTTKTPEASIRRIVQMHDDIHKVKPGLYCLKKLRRNFSEYEKETARDEQSRSLNHYYYQGLLLQIGRAKKFKTYIPPQDRNRKFLTSDSLKDMSDFEKLPPFGYKDFMRSAKSVDVIWFNERDMPHAFFEVEMTTDMGRSLEKFCELQDFYSKMKIVAPLVRQRYFEDKMKKQAYKEIRPRVKFVSTDEIGKKYQQAEKSLII